MSSAAELPELDRPPTYASVDEIHPTVDVNHQPSPDVTFATLSPTAGHEYDLVTNVDGLQIKHGENVLYFVGRYNAIGANDIVLFAGYDQHGPQLARLDFVQHSKSFKYYVGGLKSPTGDDWDIVREASVGTLFSASHFRFEAPALEGGLHKKKKYYWKKTHSSKLGSSKLAGHDYELVDETTDEPVALYTKKPTITSMKGTIRFPHKPNAGFEIACLMVLLGILEKSNRWWNAVVRAFPP